MIDRLDLEFVTGLPRMKNSLVQALITWPPTRHKKAWTK